MEIDYNSNVINEPINGSEYLCIYGNRAIIHYYVPRILKNGNPSTKTFDYCTREVTPLKKCGCCGTLKIPRKMRLSPYDWYMENTSKRASSYYKNWDKSKVEVCISCWNKLIILKNKEIKKIEQEKLIKSLRSIIYQKHKEKKQCQI
jgi:hypothetical protein